MVAPSGVSTGHVLGGALGEDGEVGVAELGQSASRGCCPEQDLRDVLAGRAVEGLDVGREEVESRRRRAASCRDPRWGPPPRPAPAARAGGGPWTPASAPAATRSGNTGGLLRPGGDPKLALEAEEIVGVHQHVEVVHLRQQLPDALQQPAVGARPAPLPGFHPVPDPPKELTAGEDPRLQDLVEGVERGVLVVPQLGGGGGGVRLGLRLLQDEVEFRRAAHQVVVEVGLPREVGLAQPQREG
uniref:Uncharacterized protein n=1 Tax=Anthurium amnicola TaxID=1678845 RepID=A0A1D1YES1_9ARAE